jgi:hypothetical protein
VKVELTVSELARVLVERWEAAKAEVKALGWEGALAGRSEVMLVEMWATEWESWLVEKLALLMAAVLVGALGGE